MAVSTTMVDGAAESERKASGIEHWLLLDGNRFVIAAGVAGTFGLSSLVLVRSGFAPLGDTQPLFYAFSGLITGNLTLVTVVVSINQLLLSREFKSPGELESEIEAAVDYRHEIEGVTNRTAPAGPSGFLRLVVQGARRNCQRLGGLAVGSVSPAARDDLDEIVADLTEEFDRIDELIDESDASVFDALSTTLETNFAHEIRRLEEFQRAHENELAVEVDDEIDGLRDRLREIDVARQYFKSVYLQVELSRLSRYLFYAGLPAIGASIAVLFVLTGSSGPPVSLSAQRILFPITVAVGVFPAAPLFSYILRTATVTERTVAITPFTTAEQDRA